MVLNKQWLCNMLIGLRSLPVAFNRSHPVLTTLPKLTYAFHFLSPYVFKSDKKTNKQTNPDTHITKFLSENEISLWVEEKKNNVSMFSQPPIFPFRLNLDF